MAQATAADAVRVAESYGLTDIGLNREKNEDFYVFDELRGIFIVADGLGGHAAGEVASRLAGEELLKFFQESYAVGGFRFLNEGTIHRALRRAHTALLGPPVSLQGTGRMGTTVVIALLQPPRTLWVANVGDSRGYVLQSGKLRQLTKDHSLVEEYREAGMVSPGEAEQYVSRSIVTQALGIKLRKAHVTRIAIGEGDTVLLCSDGLWNAVPDEQIALILRAEPDARQACRTLVDAALGAGGEDNITVEAVKIGGATH